MKKFKLFLDQKVTTWMRTEFEVEAESMDDAINITKEKFNKGDLKKISWKEIDGLSKKIMKPSENNNEPTIQIHLLTKSNIYLVLFNTKSNPNKVIDWCED